MSPNNEIIQIRIKTRNGQFLIDSLKRNDNIGELKAFIWTLTNINPVECKILMGYPPEEVFFVDDNQKIGEIFRNSREILTLEELKDNCENVNREIKKVIAEPDVPFRRMTRIEVPANNSCLFISVYFCITGQMQEKCPELRNLIAETVKNDPITYNEGFLGKRNNEYCTWIRNEDHWGGGIELSILSNYYQVEIVAVDTQNIRLNRFGEDKSYRNRIFLIFDGIHYDPLAVNSNDLDNPIQTTFSSDDQSVVEMALQLARVAKEKHQYTDVNRMTLLCNQCKKSLNQDEARLHASSTGHLDFSEITN